MSADDVSQTRYRVLMRRPCSDGERAHMALEVIEAAVEAAGSADEAIARVEQILAAYEDAVASAIRREAILTGRAGGIRQRSNGIAGGAA